MKSSKPCNAHILAVIARNYNALRASLVSDVEINVSSRNYDDLFGDTIVFIFEDIKATPLTEEAEILNHFKYRFKMIRFRAYAESKEKRLSNENIKDDE